MTRDGCALTEYEAMLAFKCNLPAGKLRVIIVLKEYEGGNAFGPVGAKNSDPNATTGRRWVSKFN